MSEEKNTKTKWKNTDKRFVAFLDILGFKDLVMRKSHDEIYEILNKISKTKKVLEKAPSHEKVIAKFGDAEISIVNFSDSIVIFSKNDDPGNFEYFLYAVRWLFSSSIKNGIPIKGGIAYGEISINKSEQIYFGQAIIDAYLIEEDVNYFGVTVHNSFDQFINQNIDNLDMKTIENILFEEKTPLKCGNITHRNVNWFRLIEHKNIEDIKKVINSFKLNASGSPRKYIDNTLDILEKVKDKLD